MKLLVAALGASLIFAGSAFGQAKVDPKAAEALMTKSGCVACHAVDKKVIGPAFKDVAAKYAGALTADESAPRVFQDAATEGARWSLPISLVLRF